MPEWVGHTALSDILRVDLSELSDESLYRNLDRLHPNRQCIESELAEREKSLFNLDDTYYLYDLTSTYFEGQCLKNPKAQRGYSREATGLQAGGGGFGPGPGRIPQSARGLRREPSRSCLARKDAERT